MGSVEDLWCSGQPKNISAADAQYIKLISLQNQEMQEETRPGDWTGTTMSVCRQATVKHGGEFGSAFGDLVKINKSSVLRNTGRYLSIMLHHQEGICLAPYLFCSRTKTSHTYSQCHKELSAAWRRMTSSGSDGLAPTKPPISTLESLSGITWRSLRSQKICG